MTASMRTRPVTADQFDQAMQSFAPFERHPHLAVAVSGGADSMALALLASRWAADRGGRISAVIVDHGLRPEARLEAHLTAVRLSAVGVSPHVLTWQGDKPSTGVQAAARHARYRLLDDWCRRHGVLHLLVAHHADDQAETFMMRVQRGSGPDGLAAMAPVRLLSACRLLRPLLEVPKSRLYATLQDVGMAWAEDPSNTDPKYARTAMRRTIAENGIDAGEIARGTFRFARARAALEAQTDCWLAHHTQLHPAGFMRCDTQALLEVDVEIRLRALSRMARCIGGKAFAPDIAAVERLSEKLAHGRGATLGGTRFMAGADRIGIYREARNLPSATPLVAGWTRWDGRFTIHLAPELAPQNVDLEVHPWSPEMAKIWPRKARPEWFRALPDAARAGLPVILEAGGIYALKPGTMENNGLSMHFAPTMPLSGSGFSVA